MIFHFRHQKILRYKEKETEQAQLHYGSALHRVKLEELAIEQLITEKHRTSHYLEQIKEQTIAALQLVEIQNYLNHIEIMIKKKSTKKYIAEEEAEKARNDLTNKKKEEKTWSVLKDRSFYRYSEEQKKTEQKMMDEIGSVYYLRNETER